MEVTNQMSPLNSAGRLRIGRKTNSRAISSKVLILMAIIQTPMPLRLFPETFAGHADSVRTYLPEAIFSPLFQGKAKLSELCEAVFGNGTLHGVRRRVLTEGLTFEPDPRSRCRQCP